MHRQTKHTSKGNILLVDDTPDNLRLLSTMLESQGYQVRKAINGQIALRGVIMAPPDLILLDINMPQMNGYEVCEQLKAVEQTSEIPIIFISALDNTWDKVKAFEMGGVDYITKPFQIQEVLARIENQLNIHRLQKQLKQQNQRLQAEISVRQRAEEEIFFLLSTIQAISEASDFNSALEVILRQVCETIDWDFGEAWVPNQDTTLLKYSHSIYAKSSELEALRQQSSSITFSRNIGLPGRIWSSQRPEWIEDASTESYRVFQRSQIAANLGIKAVFGIPIFCDEQVLAVLVFFKQTASPPNQHLIALVSAVATQLGSLIKRKQAEEALQIAEQKYHSIVDNAKEGIFQTTPSGLLLSANPALAQLYGYDSSEDLIKHVTDIGEQLYVEPYRRSQFIQAMEAEGIVSDFESQVYRKNGQVIWVEENAHVVRDTQGNILYYEGSVSNITERKLTQEALKFQKEQIEKLLLNILPAPIAGRLQQDPSTIADSFEDASVLFADIVGFTELSSRKTPKELVDLLNVIFSEFDQLAQNHRLEKIKTIGDAYMVVGGLPKPHPQHTEAIAQMALDMQAAMVQINEKTGEAFQLRIGINTGQVVAGVIGITKFIYDLWGDTVNVASRMESSGIPGEIQVTATTYERLKEQFLLAERGSIPIKGKGEMMTYLLKGVRC
ncbi:MAG: response regulator [Symploca sp. SIO2E6]|nr:response regulator [Symploca sp. SIO2E6]